jgi:hypothetical protein
VLVEVERLGGMASCQLWLDEYDSGGGGRT